jgi:hypothetical protein
VIVPQCEQKQFAASGSEKTILEYQPSLAQKQIVFRKGAQ